MHCYRRLTVHAAGEAVCPRVAQVSAQALEALLAVHHLGVREAQPLKQGRGCGCTGKGQIGHLVLLLNTGGGNGVLSFLFLAQAPGSSKHGLVARDGFDLRSACEYRQDKPSSAFAPVSS